MDYSKMAAELLKKMHSMHRNQKQKQMGDFLRGESFVLQYLHLNNGNALPSEISDSMSVSTARTTATLNSLEDKGMITRTIDAKDRRRIVVELTQAGKDVALEQQSKMHKAAARMLSSLGEEDAKEYIRIMGRIIEISESTDWNE